MLLPHGDEMIHSRVIKPAKRDDDNPIGKRNQNQILDTKECEVEILRLRDARQNFLIRILLRN